jgi:hypothetical protein
MCTGCTIDVTDIKSLLNSLMKSKLLRFLQSNAMVSNALNLVYRAFFVTSA